MGTAKFGAALERIFFRISVSGFRFARMQTTPRSRSRFGRAGGGRQQQAAGGRRQAAGGRRQAAECYRTATVRESVLVPIFSRPLTDPVAPQFLSQQIRYPRTQRSSFDPCSGRRLNWAGQASQDPGLEQIEPDLADVTSMWTNAQHPKNRIFANPGYRGPKRLAAATRAEIDDVNSHGEGPGFGSNLLASCIRRRQTINNRCFTGIPGQFETLILYLSG
jgi:hypothetical protein